MSGQIQRWVTRQADLRPDAKVLVFRGDSLTYGELEQATNRLGRALREAGCQPGDRVAILLPKSIEAILGIIAALKAGAIYVPLDPAGPAPRLARMLEISECRLVLAGGATASMLEQALALLPNRQQPRVGWMDRDAPSWAGMVAAFRWNDVHSLPAECPENQSGDDVAHILFTSGSTGLPKGVAVRHSSVIHFVDWAIRYFGISPSDRVSGHPPLHFDLSTFDLFGTFASGAELHLVPPELNLLPHKLAEFMRTAQLTQWFSVPSILTYMARIDAVQLDDFPTLRRLLWCGEVFPTPALIYWMQRLPWVRFTNLYGPTEATIASSYYTVPACPEAEREPIPIGRPCDGEELLVLDEELRPVPAGQDGELYIGGVGLSPGYWRDPERTRAAFRPRPGHSGEWIYKTGDLGRVGANGQVYLIGRADSQVKSRGYRIELGEIEAAMNSIGELQESAVVAIDTEGFEGMVICAAYVPRAEAKVTPATVRKHLAGLVPQYMLPLRWLALDAMPRNANGKVDRPTLRHEFRRRTGDGKEDGVEARLIGHRQ